MADEIQIGDIVKIKTESNFSPEMVAEYFSGDKKMSCIWYDDHTKDFKTQVFAISSLIKWTKKK